MVFSSEKEIVMNDLLVAVKSSVDHYEQFAGVVGSPKVSVFFRQLADARRELAAALENMLKDAGLLPAEPDPDRQRLSELATRIKAAVSGDDQTLLVNSAEHIEQDLEGLLQNAMAMEWPESTVQQLKRFETRLHADRERIRKKGSDLTG